MERGADISGCGTWRYRLWRVWDPSKPSCTFILLNPSTADGHQDDPTLRKCIRYAQSWGFGGLNLLNLFAFRATNPRELRLALDPVGPENDHYIRRAISDVPSVICGWGNHGNVYNRSGAVVEMLVQAGVTPQCLAVNKNGEPRHPLYCLKATQPRSLGTPAQQNNQQLM